MTDGWTIRILAASAAACLLWAGPATAQEPEDMAAMMERARRYTEPGPKHEVLERFIGTWTTSSRITMAGMETEPSEGTAVFSWLMEGRWLKGETEGSMMGRPMRSFTIVGYDNFKMSYVVSTVSSMDTAMNTAEGDLTPDGGALILYGTIDEYLTGEHDKMVKTVWRFISEDEMLMEVHDLHIGEEGTKVYEVRYTREK